MTGTRRYQYCAALVVPSSLSKVSQQRPNSADSLDWSALSQDLDVDSEDYLQVVMPVHDIIAGYNISKCIVPERWTSPYNEKWYPAIPSRSKPDMLLYELFRNQANDDSGELNSEFWSELERSGSFFGAILGAPQSGKTSILLKFLMSSFGLYLAGKDPYVEASVARMNLGSNDLHSLFLDVSSHVSPYPTSDNDRVLSTAILRIVLSRVIFLHYLLTERQQFTPGQWLLLQPFPTKYATSKKYTRRDDIFDALAHSIACPNRDLLRRLIWAFRSRIQEKISNSGQEIQDSSYPLLPIMLDEAHHFLPVDHKLWVFTAWGRAESPSMPFYTAIMDALADERIGGKVVVAGTGLRLNAPPAVGRVPYTGGVVRTASKILERQDISAYLQEFDIPPQQKSLLLAMRQTWIRSLFRSLNFAKASTHKYR